MKTIISTLIAILFLAATAQSQSFYHNKMKKVKAPNITNCAAMKPDHTFQHRRSQKSGYAVVRRRNRA